MPIRISDFSGTIPIRSRRLLPDSYATVAENVKLKSGELRGIRVPTEEHTFPEGVEPSRIFRVRDPDTGQLAWAYTFGVQDEVLRNPLVNDNFGRYYLFGSEHAPAVATFKELQNGEWSSLAVPAPEDAPTLSVFSAALENPLPAEDRVYVISYVTEWGEESVYSKPATITIQPGSTVLVNNFYTGPTNLLSGRAWKYVRLYRSVAGRASTELYKVADIEWGKSTFVDSIPDTEVVFGNLAPSGNDGPPERLVGARLHPSGALVAFHGRDIYFSEPYLPHAWPAAYKLTVEDEIVALEVIGQSVMVMTKGSPVLLFGANPATIGVNKFSSPLPCANYLSAVAFSNAVYYLSPEGLVSFGPNGPQVVSNSIVDKETWVRNFYAEDYFAVRSESDYVALRPDGTGLCFAVDKQKLTLQTLRGFGPDPVFLRDPFEGQVWYAKKNVIYRWDPPVSDESTYRWRSKEFYAPRPLNFSTAVVEFDTKPFQFEGSNALSKTLSYVGNVDLRHQVILRIWADGELRCELICESGKDVNLPAGYKAARWVFELEGQCRVHSLFVTESGVEQISG